MFGSIVQRSLYFSKEMGRKPPRVLSRLYYDKFMDGGFVLKARISEGIEGILDMTLSDDRFLLSAHRDGHVFLRDMDLNVVVAQKQGSSKRVKWYPKDNGLFVTSGTKFLNVWDTNKFCVADAFQFSGFITDHDISSHRSIVAVSMNEEVRLVDLRTGSYAQSIRSKDVFTLRFSNNNKNHIFFGDTNGLLQLWDIRKMRCSFVSFDKNRIRKTKCESSSKVKAHDGSIVSLGFDESNSRLVSLGRDSRIRIWCLLDYYNMKIPCPKVETLKGCRIIFNTSFQCRGDYGFFPRCDGAIQIVDLKDGESVKVLDTHYDSATCALYSMKDGGTLYSGGLDRNIFVWGRRTSEGDSKTSLVHQVDEDNWSDSIPCTRRLCKSSKFFCSQNSDNKPGDIEKLLADLYKDYDIKLQEPSKSFTSDFESFKDEDSQIIYDIDEEREIRRNKGTLPDDFRTRNEIKSALMEKIYSENEMRGESGVFDVEELVNILKKEKCFDVCVLDVRSDSPFFEHLIIVTCKSKRVMSGVSKYIKKLYKYKSPGDEGPSIEGLRADAPWFAMDLDNIALHFFLRDERIKIDLESLWGVGPSLDEKSMIARQQKDAFVSPLSDFTPHSVP